MEYIISKDDKFIRGGSKEEVVRQVCDIKMEGKLLCFKVKGYNVNRDIGRGDSFTDQEWNAWVINHIWNRLPLYGYIRFREIDWKG